MSNQGKVQFREGYALDESGVVSNAATNEAEVKLWQEFGANVDDKQIYPSEVITKRLSVSEAMAIDGQSIYLGDGVISARHLVQSEQLITNSLQVGNAIITPDHISLPGGTLSALSADLGEITGGYLNVSAGVDIGNASAGISIIGSTLKMMYGGAPTITLDGSTGLVTCNKFSFTADEASAINLTQGSHIVADSLVIGATGRTAGDLIRTYAQTTQPTGTIKTGDIWIHTDDGNKTYRWNGSSWVLLQDADIATAKSTADTANSTANTAKSTADTALANAGTAQSTADAAVKPGGGVAVDGSKYITTITANDGMIISIANGIKTSSSAVHTQMTADGIAVYNSSSQIVVQVDHTNGVLINDASGGAAIQERLSLARGGTEYGYIHAGSSTLYITATGTNPVISLNCTTVVCNANLSMGSGKLVSGIHADGDGAYKADGHFHFFAATTSGGSPATEHIVTFHDGLITSWQA
jgi:hypothetical protein